MHPRCAQSSKFLIPNSGNWFWRYYSPFPPPSQRHGRWLAWRLQETAQGAVDRLVHNGHLCTITLPRSTHGSVRSQSEVEEDTSNVCSRSPVLRGLPARKEQQKEKARTSFSKGERQRESKGKDKHSKEINSPTLRTSRGGSRKANQIASEKQIASSKQSTKYVDGRTKQSTTPSAEAQHDSEAKHDVVEARRQAKHDVSHAHAYLSLNCKSFLRKAFSLRRGLRLSLIHI